MMADSSGRRTVVRSWSLGGTCMLSEKPFSDTVEKLDCFKFGIARLRRAALF